MNNENTMIDAEIEIERLRAKVASLQLTVGELRALAVDAANGVDVRDDSWLQRKVRAQARALEVLNARVVNQRFVLRNLDRLGRSLSPDELQSARLLESGTVDAQSVAV